MLSGRARVGRERDLQLVELPVAGFATQLDDGLDDLQGHLLNHVPCVGEQASVEVGRAGAAGSDSLGGGNNALETVLNDFGTVLYFRTSDI